MSRLIIIGIGITIVLFVVQAAILLGAKAIQGEEVGDLLAPYTDVMPGQSMEIFTPALCNTYTDISSERIRTCSLQPEEGEFFSVNIYVRENIIRRVTLRSNTLSIGDLPLDWGRPSIVHHSGTYYARWERPAYAITVLLGERGQLNYWLPVNFLAVEVYQQTSELCQQAECPRTSNRLSAGSDMQFAENFIDVPLHGADG